ncbi:hypothetical protein IC582_006407 [Cucumis melo]
MKLEGRVVRILVAAAVDLNRLWELNFGCIACRRRQGIRPVRGQLGVVATAIEAP